MDAGRDGCLLHSPVLRTTEPRNNDTRSGGVIVEEFDKRGLRFVAELILLEGKQNELSYFDITNLCTLALSTEKSLTQRIEHLESMLEEIGSFAKKFEGDEK